MYASQHPPDVFGAREPILRNNYRCAAPRGAQTHERRCLHLEKQVWDSLESELSRNAVIVRRTQIDEDPTVLQRWSDRAAYCIPLIVEKAVAFNVRERKTPEMPAVGVNRSNGPLHEGRDVPAVFTISEPSPHLEAFP